MNSAKVYRDIKGYRKKGDGHLEELVFSHSWSPVLWTPHAKSWLIGKDSDAGRDWGQEEKGTTEDEMAGWHHGLDGGESEWILRDGGGQGGLVCCDSWGRKELDTTKRLNWTELNCVMFFSEPFWEVTGQQKSKKKLTILISNLQGNLPPPDGPFDELILTGLSVEVPPQSKVFFFVLFCF